MGTRADFYEKKDNQAELVWLGSIAFDGYPEGIDATVREARKPEFYRDALKAFFADRDDVTLPENGWPWPWNTSDTTDCAYCFTGERVVSYLGKGKWGAPIEWDEDKNGPQPVLWKHRVPDMEKRKNVTLGKRSGLIVFGGH